MSDHFQLKTRSQFIPLIEKKQQWLSIRNRPSALSRFEQLLGPQWAFDNCAMGECLTPALRRRDALNEDQHEQQSYHQQAARRLYDWSQAYEFLSVESLLELHLLLLTGKQSGVGKFRCEDIKSITEGHEPLEAVFVRDSVVNALEWFRAESFQQMHEVEKTALVLAKLVDIYPFEQACERTIRLLSNFHLLKAGYPPAIIPHSQNREYVSAIQNAFHFHTQPIIDLLTEAVSRGLAYCLNEPPPPPFLKVLP